MTKYNCFDFCIFPFKFLNVCKHIFIIAIIPHIILYIIYLVFVHDNFQL